MVLEIFTGLVGVLAVIYAGFVRFIQYKLIDKKEVDAIQAESKKISEEFKEAQKSGNEKRIEEAMKKQMGFMPKMSKMMMNQLKMMAVIFVIFFAFTWAVDQINPFDDDDVTVQLEDNGQSCDELAGDGIYSGCYKLENDAYGKWYVNIAAINGDAQVDKNHTYFFYNEEDQSDTYKRAPEGTTPIEVSLDNESYNIGDTVKISARTEGVERIEAVLESGTTFYVDLPIQIPIINVKRIVQPYWWFISISLIANLSLTAIIGQLQKKGKL